MITTATSRITVTVASALRRWASLAGGTGQPATGIKAVKNYPVKCSIGGHFAHTRRYLEASRLNRLGIQLDLQNRWEEVHASSGVHVWDFGNLRTTDPGERFGRPLGVPSFC